MIRLQFQSSPVVQCHNLPLSCPGLDFEDCSSLLWHSLVWDTQVSVPGSHMFRFDSDVLFSHWLSQALTRLIFVILVDNARTEMNLWNPFWMLHMGPWPKYMAQNLFSAHPTVCRVTCCSGQAPCCRHWQWVLAYLLPHLAASLKPTLATWALTSRYHALCLWMHTVRIAGATPWNRLAGT